MVFNNIKSRPKSSTKRCLTIVIHLIFNSCDAMMTISIDIHHTNTIDLGELLKPKHMAGLRVTQFPMLGLTVQGHM
jgi:hypothetical protein